MSEDENKALARGFIQVWAPGNLSVLDELAAPDITVIYPVLGEPVRGAAAFKQLLAHFHAACPDVEISVQEQIAEGDKVVTRWSLCGTHRGELLGVPATGRPLSTGFRKFVALCRKFGPLSCPGAQVVVHDVDHLAKRALVRQWVPAIAMVEG